MNTRNMKSTTLRGIALVATLFLGVAQAQDLYWDTEIAAGIQGGNGDWNTSTFWNPVADGSGTGEGWTAGRNAFFSQAASTVDLEDSTWDVGLLNITAVGVTLNTGTINLGGGISHNNNNGGHVLTAPLVLSSAQTFALAGAGITTFEGSLNLGSNALRIESSSDIRVRFNTNISGSADITVNTANTLLSGAERFVAFTGNNASWTGDIIIEKGVVGAHASSGYTANQVLHFANNANDKGFAIHAASPTLGGIDGDGTLRNTHNSARILTIDVGAGESYDLSGDISVADGTLGITKSGTGTQVLSGNSNLNGVTAVNVGGLIIDGIHTAAGAYTVADGARLGGNGSINGDATFNSGALFVFDPLQTLDISGTVAMDNTFSVASLVNADGTSIDWSGIGIASYTLIGTTLSDFSNIGNFGAGNAAVLAGGKFAYFETGSLELVVIPEPSTLALFALTGVAMMIGLRRRRS